MPPGNAAARRLVLRSLIVVLSLALALTGAELLLRALGIAAPVDVPPLELPGGRPHAEPFTRWDRDLIYSMVPNTRALPEYTINSRGYRSPEFAQRKPAGTVRVIVTGDSSTFGLGVREDQCWASVLRTALQRMFEGVVEVELINAGVSGYSVRLNREQLERDLLPLQPDAVVVCVTGHNDSRLVHGADDAEILAGNRRWSTRLLRMHLVRLALGVGDRADQVSLRPLARSEAEGGRWRVPLPEVERHAGALRDLSRAAGAGLVLAVTAHSRPTLTSTPYVADVGETVARVARERGVPLADVRPAFEALAPYDLFVDSVHPTPLGHRLIAREVLVALLDAVDWPAPARARAAFARAALAAAGGELPGRAPELLTGDAAPRFVAARSLCDDESGLAERLRTGDASLPAAARLHDPALGSATAPRATAPRLLALERLRAEGRAGEARTVQARLDEIYRWVRPEDAWIVACGGPHAFLDTPAAVRDLGRALLVFLADLGLPAERVDLRMAEAGRRHAKGEREAALALLGEVLALDPADAVARFDRAWLLRQSGEPERAREDWLQVAERHPDGALGRFARGLLLYDAGRPAEAERSLRDAIAAQPSLGLARYLLGRVLLETGQLDEAVRELAVATVIMGPLPEFEELRRRLAEREAQRAGAGAGAGAGSGTGAGG
jgi:lysophospholipase L1-like esterase/tetratricopeptide (TPR) repeat protein